MVRTFNVGIGLTFVVRRAQVEATLAALPEAVHLGSVVEAEPGVPRVAFI